MRRRITLAFVAVLAVALVLAGTVSLLLVRHAASVNTQRTLLAQVRSLVQNVNEIGLQQQVLELIEHIGGIKVAAILVVDTKGHTSSQLTNIPTASLNLLPLTHGKAISGSHNHYAYAAAPIAALQSSLAQPRSPKTTFALAIESPESFSADNIWYFLLASGISLLVAVSLAPVVTRRIARRVNAVADAAGHIAAGDFATRVEIDPRDYPELRDLNASINAMAEDLERAREAERAFLLSISHDLRTPLTSIRGYSEAIAEGAVEDVARAARVVVAESDRLERLIDDLLDLARLRARRFSFDLAPFELSSVVRITTEGLSYRANHGDTRLELDVPEKAITIVADAHRVSQIVANLVENALKFATSLVTVKVAVVEDASGRDRDGGFALIVVGDDGPGIEPEDLPHIFEPLYTSDRDPAKAGTGLGLAIVEELTEAMNGRVAVDSRNNGSGTRFSVWLPLTSNDVPARRGA